MSRPLLLVVWLTALILTTWGSSGAQVPVDVAKAIERSVVRITPLDGPIRRSASGVIVRGAAGDSVFGATSVEGIGEARILEARDSAGQRLRGSIVHANQTSGVAVFSLERWTGPRVVDLDERPLRPGERVVVLGFDGASGELVYRVSTARDADNLQESLPAGFEGGPIVGLTQQRIRGIARSRTGRIVSTVSIVAALDALGGAAPQTQAPSVPSNRTTAAPAATLRVVAHAPLSGGQAALGMGIRNATILATEEWAGRLADVGVRVAADAADDEARPATGVANATRLVRDSSVIAIIGHLNSGVAIPSSEIYAQGGLAMVSPANTNPMVTERGLGNVFRVIGRDDVQGTAMATFARDGLRLRHVAIAHDSTSYGTGTASTFAAQAPIVGISILEAGHFGAAVPAIVSAQPDGVFFGGIYDDAARFLLDLSRSGYRGRFLGTDGLDSAEFARLAGSQVVGVHYATVAGPITAYPEATQLARRYEQRFRVPAEPFVAEAYDATSIVLSVIHAIARAQGGHTISRSAVVDGLKQIQAFPGATGPISFSRKGDRNPAQYFVVRVNSSNPSAWDRNQLVQRYRISPPP